jgi:hypothetical protein
MMLRSGGESWPPEGGRSWKPRMEGDTFRPSILGPNDATLDAPASPASSLSVPNDRPCPPMALVEGSGPCMTSETQCLLRFRLRVASLVMFAGFAAFLVWQLYNVRWNETADLALVSALVLVTAVTGLLGAVLSRACPISIFVLRVQELVVFGLSAGYFVLWEYIGLSRAAAEYSYLPTPLVPWIILTFIYATFIPNAWPRAAAVIGTFCASPLVVLVLLAAYHPDVMKAANADFSFISQTAVVAAIAAVASVVGVQTINHLRLAAFEARQLGQYRLTRLLGSGGMGDVYLAEHLLMKRPCAVKVIRPEKAGDPKVLARFEREVHATAKLSHWNSIEIFDYGHAEDGTFYYVMEYLPGMSLQELVFRFGPLPPERVVYLLRQTCDALGEAHAAGLIHRDIKPANIFAAHRGGMHDVAKLLDFGLVKPLEDDRNLDLTQEGSVTGSPLYMAPEQAMGDAEPDARSDVYSLGAVAYYLLTGQPPFVHDKPLKVLLAHAKEEPVPPSRLRPEIPDDLEMVVLRCLAKEPADRYQSAADLAAALDDCELAGRWTRHTAARWWAERPQAASEPAPALS